MLVIGLTGSIATGKSFVANYFLQKGFAVFDADKIAHDIINNDKYAFLQIAAIFPEVIISGKIDRQILGTQVFSNKEKLKQLENIIHPLIAIKRDEFLKSECKNEAKLVVMEVPLLFETALNKICDYVIVTWAKFETQKKRIKERNGWSDQKINNIIALQMPQEQKIALSNFAINTDCSPNEVMVNIDHIINQILS